MKKIPFTLAAFLALTHVTHATLMPDESTPPKAQVVDVDQWMEESGAAKMVSPWEHTNRYIANTLRRYTPDHLREVTDILKSSGIWNGLDNNLCSLEKFLAIVISYPPENFRTSVEWLRDTGHWPTKNLVSVLDFLGAIVRSPNKRDNSVLELLKTHFPTKEHDLWHTARVIHTLRGYAEEHYEGVTGWLIEKKAGRICKNHAALNRLLDILLWEIYSESFDKNFALMETMGMVEKCQGVSEWEALYKLVKLNRFDRLEASHGHMKENGLWDRCANGDHVRMGLEMLGELNYDLFVSWMAWVKDAGVWDAKTQNGDGLCSGGQIIEILSTIREIDEENREVILPWVRDGGFMGKGLTIEGLSKVLRLCQSAPVPGNLGVTLKWLQDSGAIEASPIENFSYLLEIALKFTKEELESSEKWMKDSGAWNRCVPWGRLATLLSIADNNSDEGLREITAWMKESGLWDMCSGEELCKVIVNFNPQLLPTYKEAESLLKKFDLWRIYEPVEVSRKIMKFKNLEYRLKESVDKLMKKYDSWSKSDAGDEIRELILKIIFG